MELRRLEVGQLFEPAKTHYEEGIKFEFTQSGPVLFIMFERPTEKEIEAIRVGKFTIKFYEHENIIFMLFKLGSLNWMDAPFNIHLSKPFEFEKDLEKENIGFGLQIFLIDATTGILKAMRLIGLGHEYSIRLRDAMLKQKEMDFNKDSYNFKLNDIYRRYSTEQLVEYAKWYYKTER